MADLLQEHLRAVFKPRLVSLAKDRVKWLVEEVCWVNVRKRLADDELHALYGVVRESGSVQEDRRVDCEFRDRIQNRLVVHSFYRERDLVKFEFAGQQHPADLLEQIFHRAAVLGKQHSVIEVEAAFPRHIRCAVIIRTIDWPKANYAKLGTYLKLSAASRIRSTRS